MYSSSLQFQQSHNFQVIISILFGLALQEFITSLKYRNLYSIPYLAALLGLPHMQVPSGVRIMIIALSYAVHHPSQQCQLAIQRENLTENRPNEKIRQIVLECN